ncbi:hypothetical protein Pelo_15339 [Pelomyxa schiedti]|nr:hypothetical protein Pelo_15339 [Pelomyxa schiedti]
MRSDAVAPTATATPPLTLVRSGDLRVGGGWSSPPPPRTFFQPAPIFSPTITPPLPLSPSTSPLPMMSAASPSQEASPQVPKKPTASSLVSSSARIISELKSTNATLAISIRPRAKSSTCPHLTAPSKIHRPASAHLDEHECNGAPSSTNGSSSGSAPEIKTCVVHNLRLSEWSNPNLESYNKHEADTNAHDGDDEGSDTDDGKSESDSDVHSGSDDSNSGSSAYSSDESGSSQNSCSSESDIDKTSSEEEPPSNLEAELSLEERWKKSQSETTHLKETISSLIEQISTYQQIMSEVRERDRQEFQQQLADEKQKGISLREQTVAQLQSLLSELKEIDNCNKQLNFELDTEKKAHSATLQELQEYKRKAEDIPSSGVLIDSTHQIKLNIQIKGGRVNSVELMHEDQSQEEVLYEQVQFLTGKVVTLHQENQQLQSDLTQYQQQCLCSLNIKMKPINTRPHNY